MKDKFDKVPCFDAGNNIVWYFLYDSNKIDYIYKYYCNQKKFDADDLINRRGIKGWIAVQKKYSPEYHKNQLSVHTLDEMGGKITLVMNWGDK